MRNAETTRDNYSLILIVDSVLGCNINKIYALKYSIQTEHYFVFRIYEEHSENEEMQLPPPWRPRRCLVHHSQKLPRPL